MDQLVGIAQFASGIGTVAMLVVWTVYLALAYREYKESHRPWFILHMAGDGDASSRCVLVNMGAQVAHVSMVLAVVHTTDLSVARRLRSQFGPPEEDLKVPDAAEYREGPLAAGDSMSLGSFGEIFDDMVKAIAGDKRYEAVESVEVRVVAASPVTEEGPLGARREFRMYHNGTELIRPLELKTEQMRDKKARGEVEHWVNQGWDRATSEGVWNLDESSRNNEPARRKPHPIS